MQALPKLDGPAGGLSLEALGSTNGRAESEVGTPVLTEQWRRRWMGAKGEEQIEIGPMIGRGGEQHLGVCPLQGDPHPPLTFTLPRHPSRAR